MAVPTRGETFQKMLHHLREAQSCFAIMAHLHNTEDNSMDRHLASGWLTAHELMNKWISKITMMGQGRLH